MQELISVIIPTFNRAKFLSRCVKSVLAQNYPLIQIIVIDDGSTDNTREVVSKFDRVDYYFQSNKGVSAARNYGVEKAQGRYIAFLDSDDQWLANKLELQYQLISQTSHVWCHCNELWFRDNQLVTQHAKHTKDGGDLYERSLKLCLIGASCVLMQKKLFVQFGGFREDFPACEDYDLWLKILSQYEIGFIKENLVHKFAGHDDQLSYKYFAMDYWRIKTLDWLLGNASLIDSRREATLKVLVKKSRQLLKGYLKHKNLVNYEEISHILKARELVSSSSVCSKSEG